MLNRFTSRKTDLGKAFLAERLRGAVSYDRIAGYFCSSCLEIAGEAIEAVAGKVRIVCNGDLVPEDVKVAEFAAQRQKQEWTAFHPEEMFTSAEECARLERLYGLLKSGKLEIRVVPDAVYGFLHGKAGVITYGDGRRTSFIGSMNETKRALSTNYEIVWEDDASESADWVQSEFDFFWNHELAVPLAEFVIEDVHRVANRRPVSIADWKKSAEGGGEDAVAAVAAEEPVFREEYGLWAHQKYFVLRAFKEHQEFGGARLVLADMVGLGKTLQLAMVAKLVALTGRRPILVVAPKTLLEQWQDEFMDMLECPSAVWTGRGWKDESGVEHPARGAEDIRRCPRRIGIVSQGIVTARTEAAKALLEMPGGYDLVVLDEAHRARRRNLAQDPNTHRAQPNNLLRFLFDISPLTRSMLLATATPIQLRAVEAFDLLGALGMDSGAERILGDEHSVWRREPQTGLDYVSGAQPVPRNDAQMWELIRNPFPLSEEHDLVSLRHRLDLPDDKTVLSQSTFQHLAPPEQRAVRGLYFEEGFVERFNPYVRTIVRRTRELLEKTVNPVTGLPYLKKIEVELHGEREDESLPLAGYLHDAYRIAEEFCDLLAKRVKGGGFMSTLLLRRIGSTMLAGENTARKMLSWAGGGGRGVTALQDGGHRAGVTLPDVCDEEDDDAQGEEDGELRDLTKEEIEKLRLLVDVLGRNKDQDPKFLRVLEILRGGVDGEGGWAERGCILFSQYFDSARYVAENLSREFGDRPVGLYAGGDKSGVFLNGAFTKMEKNEIKRRVRDGGLKLLVGTDAASEGLNLQRLSTLINIDLPWNPTRLEQRKGRIQRIGQAADRILIYNMRYKDSVEDVVHRKLSGRMKEIHDIFGQIPEVLEDVWVLVANHEEEKARERIDAVARRSAFQIKYEDRIPPSGDWERCEVVLSHRDKIAELSRGW